MNSNENKPELIKFPCEFPIKAIGYAKYPIAEILTAAVHKFSPHMEHIPVTTNPSSNQRFIAATAIVQARSQQQLDNIYQELSSHEGILVVL